MQFVAERLRGEVARFDITDKSGKVIVAKDKRVTVRHTREFEQSGTTHISVPEDFMIGRVIAKDIVDGETGEIIAKANDELTEVLLKKLRGSGVTDLECIYTNELDQGAYLSQTLRADETADDSSGLCASDATKTCSIVTPAASAARRRVGPSNAKDLSSRRARREERSLRSRWTSGFRGPSGSLSSKPPAHRRPRRPAR